MQRKFSRARLMCSAAAVALAIPLAAHAQAAEFNIAAQPLTSALKEFGVQSQYTVVAQPDVVAMKTSRGVSQSAEPEVALAALLDGTGLGYRREGDTFLIVRADAPQGGSAAGDGAEGTVEALIVTAQKREEDIQDVPIAISAFTQEDLTRSQVAGGPDLITQVPNMTFTKTNFSSYSVQIRGIGTQAISATTDPAVAVAFNNTSFIRNRFFEQEFYDLQRVEVLRGPQGTLYGRNATAGVVNIISAKPKFQFEAKASADVSNFNSSRIEGMVNIPLVEDAVALRLAGAWTKRDGYATNEITGNPIDGRDLWSTRVSLRFAPNDRIDANLIWEHFEEDDDRLRSGKQLCKKDVVTEVGGVSIPTEGGGFSSPQARQSQGCTRESLYSPDSFQTPNGWRLPYYHPIGAIFFPNVPGLDPYASKVQSRDLRVIESTVDPSYKAKTDLVELLVNIDLSDSLTLSSETAWLSDFVFSTQDFNRFNTSSGAFALDNPANIERGILSEDGFFCDPQIGCADRLVGVDLSTAKTTQFAQEFRLASNYDGPFNFNLGVNFLRYDTEEKYYVFINALSLFAAISPFSPIHDNTDYPYIAGVTDNHECLVAGPVPPIADGIASVAGCQYIDPNPIGSLNDLGHNYFLSNNPYKLISYAVFGEAYYNITEALKLTAGLRWSVDKKEAPRMPSWVLAADTVGYPVAEVIEQEWREPSGRLVLDWKPDLSFTDETLVYASYARGYKAGGANPPSAGIVVFGANVEDRVVLIGESATRPRTFEPEFVNAYEIGAKNTLLDGRLTVNTAAFYYDYQGYQISRIVDRAAYNDNFDATVWGVELEADWRPLENLRLGFKTGYEKTRIADGETSIDLMDRTAGKEGWVAVSPFPTFTQNCIFPTYLYVYDRDGDGDLEYTDLGNASGGTGSGCSDAYLFGLDPITGEEYVPNPVGSDPDGAGPKGPWQYYNGGAGTYYPNYPGFDPSQPDINNGEGFSKQLGGNELPNAPNWTVTITGDYTVPLPNDWLVNLHTDLHWQAESWWRIFNDHEYNKLDEYFTMNLAAIFTNEEAGWNIMAYIKNVTDETAITGAFLYSDDVGLPTNVFLTEPRLYGLRATKTWTGGPLLGTFGARREGPYPFTVELGGMVQRQDAPNEVFRPTFADAFASDVEPFSDQENDLDWGDGREVKLTYATQSGWKASASARWGETNGGHRNIVFSEDSVKGCGFPIFYGCPAPEFYATRSNFSNAETLEKEEHTVVDFMVGRDVGLGFGSSSVSGGLRYAQFDSRTAMDMYGVPDWEFDIVGSGYFAKYHLYNHRYESRIEIDREFKGVGPVLSWDASVPLLGDRDTGTLDLDAALSGGVLFGKQKVNVSGDERAAFYDQSAADHYFFKAIVPPVPGSVTETQLDIAPRSKSVTVPTLGASLGLSYKVDRFSVGAGYRWERYYDAMDGGVFQAKQYDRTIDGPYFKLSVGFGG